MTLDDVMKEKGLSDEWLATQLNVSRPYVSRLRRGERTPSVTVAVKIEELTGFPPSGFAEQAR